MSLISSIVASPYPTSSYSAPSPKPAAEPVATTTTQTSDQKSLSQPVSAVSTEASDTSKVGSNSQTAPQSAVEIDANQASSRTNAPQAKAEEVQTENTSRRAAEQRIQAAQARALIDKISPVESSPLQSVKSYEDTLMSNRSANAESGSMIERNDTSDKKSI